jgi:hypothetical protein
MPNVQSTLRYDSPLLKGMDKVWAPPICFETFPKKEYRGKTDLEDEEKYREYNIPLQDGRESSDNYSRKLPVFEEGGPEAFCTFLEAYYDFLVEAGYVDMPDTQLRVLRSLFAGEAKDIFTVAYNLRHTKNMNREEPYNDEWELDVALNDVAKHVFGNNWETAVRRQKGYLRKHLSMGNGNPRDFGNRLSKINRFINYFPKKLDSDSRLIYWTVLPEDELVDILDSAKKPDWHLMMLSQGKSPESFETVQEALVYYEQLYTADCLREALHNQHDNNHNTRKKGKRERPDDENGHNKNVSGRFQKRPKNVKTTNFKPEQSKCRWCGKVGFHRDESCWENPKNKNNETSDANKGHFSKFATPSKKQEFAKKPVREHAHIMEAISTMINDAAIKKKEIANGDKKPHAKDNKEGKHHRDCPNYVAAHDSDNDSLGDLSKYLTKLRSWSNPITTSVTHPRFKKDSSSMHNIRTSDITTCYDYCIECETEFISDEEIFVFGELHPPPTKKHKTIHYTAEIIVEVRDRHDNIVPIRALLDTGTTSSIILREFVRKGRAKSYKGQTTTWSTYGGTFSTNRKALIDLNSPSSLKIKL